MNCNYCNEQFDHNAHVPRLLIFCGHSMCQLCCLKLQANSRIQCPQCFSNTFIQQVSFLPKNLALLKVNTLPSNTAQGFCLKHQKKYEAFCKKQKQLICVDCILHDSHRNHQMDSIKNAYYTEQTCLQQSILHLESLLQANQNRYQQNLLNQKQSEEIYENNHQNCVRNFQQIRDLINKQQQNLLNKLKEQYATSKNKFHEKNMKYAAAIQNISNSLSSLKDSARLSQIQFLNSANQREQILSQVNSNVEDTQKVIAFNQTKSSIAQTIVKSLEKNFKTGCTTTTNTNKSNIPLPNPQKKQKKMASPLQVQNIPPLKSFDGQPFPNQKQVTKKVIRKDPLPPNPTKVSTNGLSRSSPNVQQKRKSRPGEKQRFDIVKNCDVSVVQQKDSMYNSFFSNMTSFLTQQKYIYVIGGFDDESSNIVKLNLTTLCWEQVSNLNSPRSKFGCVNIDKNIFIMGGKKGRQRVSDAEVWNNGNCVTNFALRKKRSGFGIVTFEHLIYVIGGNDGENILNAVQVLNTLTGQWSRAESMIEARDELAVCLGKDGNIFAIGGFGGKNNEPLKSVEMYNIKTDKWSKMPPLNIERRALAAASLSDGIYAIGGFDGSQHLSSIQKYEQGSSSWVKIADLKRGRCTHSAISISDTQQIIILGGFDEEALDSVQRYSPISNECEEISKMPSPRFMHSSVLITE